MIWQPRPTSKASIRLHAMLPLTGSVQMASSVLRCLLFTRAMIAVSNPLSAGAQTVVWLARNFLTGTDNQQHPMPPARLPTDTATSRYPHRRIAWLAAVMSALASLPAQAQTPPASALSTAPAAIPSFAELQAAGARVGAIRINNQNVFDLEDPQENNALFRLANRLHVQTRSSVIERALLFKTGEPLSVRLIDETERLLRANRFLYDVKILPVSWQGGVVDIEVQVRDTWSLDPGVSAGRSGGANSSSLSLREQNLLGTGLALGLGHTNTVDRSSNEFSVQYNRAFDGWTQLGYAYADNTDGHRQAITVLRPFYALDARWAAGVSATREDRIDSVYSAGLVASQYRHQSAAREVFGGWSPGLVDGWTRRYSVGISSSDDRYRNEAGLSAPAQLPADQKLVAPFFRFEVVQDAFQQRSNRDQMGRPEFVSMGFAANVQLGRALTSLGSTQDLWLYSGSVSQGFLPLPKHELLTSASLSGQYGAGRVQRQLLTASGRYYWPLSARYLLYGAASVDTLTNPDPVDLLTLGGDNGLRGYPLRYQIGEHRALFTVEARAYSDLYVYRLFRVGGAAFVDVGHAWGGANPNPTNPGWLANAGIGLRIFNSRTSFGNVLHADVAVPLNRDPSIKSVQFLLKSKLSF